MLFCGPTKTCGKPIDFANGRQELSLVEKSLLHASQVEAGEFGV